MQLTDILYWIPVLYALTINIIAFLAMWWDKRKAAQREWRVAEATLYILGFIGGAIGIIGGIFRFRHKTQKRPFQVIAFIDLVASLIIYWFIGIQYL
ncbi:MAG: DUF1294 domain-containing protein [Candidatus Thorarchaeota archaeon]|jgi:uncharacterized membrane protein YsdA (DUF1294 family)